MTLSPTIIARYLAPCVLWILMATSEVCAQSVQIVEIDTTGYPTMRASFMAYDSVGAIRRPGAGDVRLLENGRECVIGAVDYAVRNGDTLSSVLVFDLARSTDSTMLTIARRAARAWIQGLDLGMSECAITGFDSQGHVWQDLTVQRDLLMASVERLTMMGRQTNLTAALADPVTGALQVVARGTRKRVIVLMTDGRDDIKRVDSVIAAANAAQCVVYAVMLYSTASASLREIVTKTGGVLVEHINTAEQAERVYRRILQTATDVAPCVVTWRSMPRCDGDRPVKVNLRLGQASDTAMYAVMMERSQPLVIEPAIVRFANPIVGRTIHREITVTAQHGDIDVRNIRSSNTLFMVRPSSFRLLKGERTTLTVSYYAIDSTYSYTDFTFDMDTCSQRYYGAGGVHGRRAAIPALKITSPTVDNTLIEGGEIAIGWNGVPHFEKVRLDYSSDDGSTWNIITLDASGWQYVWKNIPLVPTKNILLRAWQLESLTDPDTLNPTPKVLWQHALGGTGDDDRGYCIAEAADGGILVAGSVNGTGGDVPSFKGGSDIMVLKLDPANGKILWTATMGGRNYDAASSIIGMPDNSVVVSGYIATASDDTPPRSAGWTDAWLAKYDGATGRKIWERVIGGGGHDRARCVIRASDGSVVFAGTSYSSEAHLGTYKGQYDIWVGRLDAKTGDVLKLAKFGGSGADIGVSIIELPDGSFAVCGSTTSVDGDVLQPLGDYDGLVLRIDSELDSVLWSSTVGSTGLDRLTSLVQAPDGAIMLSGMVLYLKDPAVRTSLDYDAVLIKIDSATGQQIWQRKYGGSAWEIYPEYDGTSRCLTRSVDGNIVLAASTYSKDRDIRGPKGQADFWVAKVDPDSGDLIWRRNLGGASRDYAHGIVETADGSLFVVGQVESNDGEVTDNNGGWSFDWWVVRLDEQAILQRVVSTEAIGVVRPTATARDVDMGVHAVGSSLDTIVAGMVVNIGEYPFEIRDITISGADAESFNVVSGMDGEPLTPGSSRAATLRFRPGRVGVHEATIHVVTQSTTLVRKIRGEAKAPSVEVVNPVIDFGTVSVDVARDTVGVATIRNVGTMPLAIRSVSIGAPNRDDFLLTDADTMAVLKPGEEYPVDLRFVASAFRGLTTATLSIDHDGLGSPTMLQLVGRGVYDTVRTTVAIDSINAVAGQNVTIRMVIAETEHMDAVRAPKMYTATIEMNPTVLHISDPAFSCVAIDHHRCTLSMTGIRGSGPVLERIPAMVTLGTTDYAPLRLVEFRWLDTPFPTVVTLRDGFVRIDDGCEEGGYRLFIPSNASMGLTCRPNPAETTVELLYSVAEASRITIDIVDRTGRIVMTPVADLDVQPGLYVQQVDVSQLSAGPYMVVLHSANVTLYTRMDVAR